MAERVIVMGVEGKKRKRIHWNSAKEFTTIQLIAINESG